LAYIQAIIILIHNLDLMRKLYSSAYITLGKRSHSLYTNIKYIKNSVKLDEGTIVY
jgi:hypothetical protein